MNSSVVATYWITMFLRNQNYRGSTKKNYLSTLQKYFAYEDEINDVLTMHLSEVIELIHERANTDNDKTLNEHFNRIRKFLIWYSKLKKITPKYDLESLTHKYVNNTNPIILDNDEIAVATLSLEPDELATFFCYLDTGIRKEEIKQLEPIHFKEKKQVNIFSSKTSTERTIYAVSDRVRKIIEDNKIESFVAPHVLANKFMKIRKENDIVITFNILRHTFATIYANKGGNPMRLTKLMGNSLDVIIKNYYHNNTEEIKNEIDSIINHKKNFKTQEKYIEYLELRIKELEEQNG